jgi:ABC-type branched-subunit amino acid transport system substrate-binding protein
LVTVAFPLEDSIKFLKTLRVLDPEYKVHIACDFTTELATKDYIEAFGADRLEGCISVNLAQTASDTFKNEYKQKFGIDMLLTGDTTYDAVGLIKKLSQKYPGNEWVKALSAENYVYADGVSGEIRFNDDGTRLDSDPVVSVFKGSEFVPVK